jgi:hypothetical protein
VTWPLSWEHCRGSDRCYGWPRFRAKHNTRTSLAPTRALISTLPHTSTQTLLGQEPVQLTLDPNSTFAKLTGVTTLNVFTANTENKTGGNLTAKTCGDSCFLPRHRARLRRVMSSWQGVLKHLSSCMHEGHSICRCTWHRDNCPLRWWLFVSVRSSPDLLAPTLRVSRNYASHKKDNYKQQRSLFLHGPLLLSHLLSVRPRRWAFLMTSDKSP